MQRATLQFHALPEEVVFRLNEIAHGFHVLGISLRPGFSLQELAWPLASGLSVDRIVISNRDFDQAAISLQDFAAKNPDCMYVDFPKVTDGFLTEAALGYVVHDAATAKLWAGIVSKFKKSLLTGVVAIDPTSGVAVPLKSHRFTEGAYRLQGLGVAMRPCAGNALVKLGAATAI